MFLQSFKIALKLCIKQISFGRAWTDLNVLDPVGRDFRSLQPFCNLRHCNEFKARSGSKATVL